METLISPLSRLEIREASDGRHEIEGIAVPYGEITRKTPGGIPERFKFGAFGSDVGALVGKIRLLDNNHDDGRRPVGVATALEDRTGGLFTRFRFYNTPEGRAAFENVAEDTYGGLSVGFLPTAEAVVNGVREIRAARMDHVSLADEPAYDGAAILAVRHADADLSRYAFLRTVPKLTLDAVPDRLFTALVRRS